MGVGSAQDPHEICERKFLQEFQSLLGCETTTYVSRGESIGTKGVSCLYIVSNSPQLILSDKMYLKFITKENAKAADIVSKRVIIDFTFPGIMQLIVSPIPCQITRKAMFDSCRSGGKHDGNVEINHSIN